MGLRMEVGEFKEWISKQSDNILFFDGASKSNPRVVGRGGGGGNMQTQRSICYQLLMGNQFETNNEAEALALYAGL
jgi:ribonuclease HI